MISEKNILYTDFEGEKLARICLGKKYPALKKISLMTYTMLTKKILHCYISGKKLQRFGKKILA